MLNPLALSVLLLLPIAQTGPATQPGTQPGTQPATQAAGGGDAFVERVEAAHGGANWDSRDVFHSEIVVEFGGNRMLDGTMAFTPSMSRVRMDLEGGVTLGWDGETAWMSPADAEMPRARFHVLTWPYFLALPFKLDDPGTRIESMGDATYAEGETMPAAKLTFGEGVGDAPDDWYVLYRDPQTDRLVAAAYIVTYGTAVEEAEKEPHAVVYEAFREVDGVTVPLRWNFYNWTAERGIHGEAIGEVMLADPRFVGAGEVDFSPPADARELSMPE